MQKKADIVIIGGGIIGASVAYHITQLGTKNVLLIERNQLGSGTTAYTAGWVRLQAGDTDVEINMSKIALKELKALHAEHNIGLNIKGSISVNTKENESSEMGLIELYNTHGVEIEILRNNEVKKLVPIINADDLGFGRYCSEDATVDANALLHTYVRLAKMRGASFQEGVDVTNIIVERNKIVGVNTTNGIVYSPMVVNAAGIFSAQIGKMVEVEIPIIRRLGHIVYTDEIASISVSMPLVVVLNPEQLYIGSTGKCADYTIGDFNVTHYNHKPDLDRLLDEYFDDLLFRSPELAKARVTNCIAGVRACTPDGFPILGSIAKVDGFYNACGLGSGIVQAPAVGQMLSHSILNLPYHSVNIQDFNLDRFHM
jgi:glycine/D-amino acid oxidase-like deaminating enzyme